MNRNGHNQARFFIGHEIERTPAHGMKTLFVVGLQDVTAIGLAFNEHKCEHIYFGANHSFPRITTNNDQWFAWEDMIRPFLDRHTWCTLEIDSAQCEGLVESSLPEHRTFIPMISCKLPYLRLLGYNAVLKLDDKDFDKSNPGVWCHNLHALQDRASFTDWNQYQNDQVIR